MFQANSAKLSRDIFRRINIEAANIFGQWPERIATQKERNAVFQLTNFGENMFFLELIPYIISLLFIFFHILPRYFAPFATNSIENKFFYDSVVIFFVLGKHTDVIVWNGKRRREIE